MWLIQAEIINDSVEEMPQILHVDKLLVYLHVRKLCQQRAILGRPVLLPTLWVTPDGVSTTPPQLLYKNHEMEYLSQPSAHRHTALHRTW